MNWIYVKDEFIKTDHINRVKFEKDNSVKLWLVGDPTVTVYYNISDNDRRVLTKLVNNDDRTDS